VRASGTTLTGLFGVGPVIAATIIGGAVAITESDRISGHCSTGQLPTMRWSML